MHPPSLPGTIICPLRADCEGCKDVKQRLIGAWYLPGSYISWIRERTMNLLKAMFKNRDRLRKRDHVYFCHYLALYVKRYQGYLQLCRRQRSRFQIVPNYHRRSLLVTTVGKFLTCTQEDDDNFYETNKSWLKVLAVFALLSVYVYSFKILGYLLSTFVAGVLCVFLLKEDRKVRWYSPILFSAGLTGIMYLLFGELLSIVLPVGTIWKLF